MAHAYTPGLTIARETTVRRRRTLPLKGEVLVRQGQPVEANAVVARAEVPGDVHAVNVAGHLGIRAEEIRDYMLKTEGQQVREGEALAQTRPWIKLLRTVCAAPVTGTVENVSEVTGQVLIREPARPVELLAYVRGRVVEVSPGEGVVMETRAAMVQGIFGVGGECVGRLKMIVQDAAEEPDEAALDGACKGCVVVCGAAISANLVAAARRTGVKALVAGGVPAAELRGIVGYDIGVAVTGSEDIGLTLVVTEGFGRMPMAKNTFELLRSFDGHEVSVNGATQIRAGVLRPEIIIPLDGDSGARPRNEAQMEEDGLHEGSRVRIIRQPHFGRIGFVTELVPEPLLIETEARVRALRVGMDDGQTLTVPRANVEVISD